MSNRKFKQISTEEAKLIQYDIPLWYRNIDGTILRSIFSPETRRKWPLSVKACLHPGRNNRWYIEVADNDNPEYE